jgi:hypothetical protein
MTKKIIIPYFPKELKYFTPVLLGVAVFLFIKSYPIWAVVLVLVAILILATHYVTEIDLQQKRYSDYISLLGLRLSNEISSFQNLDHIVITKGRYAQTINTRVQSRQIDWVDYTATLLVDGGKPLNLITRNSKRELVSGIKPFADFLKVAVEDRTTRVHYWINFNKLEEPK